MAKLDSQQQQLFDQLAAPYLQHPQVQRMKRFIQHGSITTYDHCLRVAQTSFAWSRKLSLHIHDEDLVAGALLHDFYLYDWHDRSTSKPHHATKHPLYAAENASFFFEISPRCRSIIESHMWPLPPNRVPQSTEGWIVCAADKWCSLYETLFMRKVTEKIS